MGFIKEFKEFAVKGNVMDLAVGVVLGVAFNAIVGAVVDNILMPVVGMITGGVDFDKLAFKVGDAELKYGTAIGALIKFIIVALFLFIVVKAMTASKRKEEAAAPPAPPEDITLLREIRDSLKK